MREAADLSGEKFGRLTVSFRLPNSSYGAVMWMCKCDCGNSHVASGKNLKWGNVKSCKCLARDLSSVRERTHGMSFSPEFKSWSSMKDRCLRKTNHNYHNYGARGITVCDRWINSFENFYKDMGERPAGKTLDRFPNNSGNYEPGNCRWATPSEQLSNTRNSVIYSANGITDCLSGWARRIGIHKKTLRIRISSGWPIELAITAAKGRKRTDFETRKDLSV